MIAVQLIGHGGFDKLVYRTDVPKPVAAAGEVLIEVGAAGVNNTDINTRIGWYSKSVSEPTSSGAAAGLQSARLDDSSWAGTGIRFPRIQGIDVCGRITEVGEGVDPARVGERVLVEPCLRAPVGFRPGEAWYLGSECDGGFAQFVTAPAVHAHRIESPLSDVELASFPCSYSTAENMIERTGLKAGETVLVTGASGGVGSAALQLAKRRRARVIAIAAKDKNEAIAALGADRVIARDRSLLAELGKESVDAVIDIVAGPTFPELLDVLKRGGRYAVSGAIGGPIVSLDVRTLYLKDLSFFGCTMLGDRVFADLVSYIERGEIKPLVAATYPLADIVRAQQDFLAKKHVGKLVLIPPRT